MRWEGVPIILTSNILPSIMHHRYMIREDDGIGEFNNHNSNYLAFHLRIKVIKMEFPSSTNDDLPYTEEDLALYMLDYIIK